MSYKTVQRRKVQAKAPTANAAPEQVLLCKAVFHRLMRSCCEERLTPREFAIRELLKEGRDGKLLSQANVPFELWAAVVERERLCVSKGVRPNRFFWPFSRADRFPTVDELRATDWERLRTLTSTLFASAPPAACNIFQLARHFQTNGPVAFRAEKLGLLLQMLHCLAQDKIIAFQDNRLRLVAEDPQAALTLLEQRAKERVAPTKDANSGKARSPHLWWRRSASPVVHSQRDCEKSEDFQKSNVERLLSKCEVVHGQPLLIHFTRYGTFDVRNHPDKQCALVPGLLAGAQRHAMWSCTMTIAGKRFTSEQSSRKMLAQKALEERLIQDDSVWCTDARSNNDMDAVQKLDQIIARNSWKPAEYQLEADGGDRPLAQHNTIYKLRLIIGKKTLTFTARGVNKASVQSSVAEQALLSLSLSPTCETQLPRMAASARDKAQTAAVVTAGAKDADAPAEMRNYAEAVGAGVRKSPETHGMRHSPSSKEAPDIKQSTAEAKVQVAPEPWQVCLRSPLTRCASTQTDFPDSPCSPFGPDSDQGYLLVSPRTDSVHASAECVDSAPGTELPDAAPLSGCEHQADAIAAVPAPVPRLLAATTRWQHSSTCLSDGWTGQLRSSIFSPSALNWNTVPLPLA